MAVGVPTPRVMTVEEFFALPDTDDKQELVRGELRVTPPAGGPHGGAGTNLVIALGAFAQRTRLGRVFGDGVAYVLTRIPHTVRVPDVSFVRADRLPANGLKPGPLQLAPDLAVEVLSPSETASSLAEKLHDYTVAGTSLIWVVDPERRSVTIVATHSPVRSLYEGDMLDGGAVVPGFTCSVADIFDGIERPSSP